MDKAKAHKVEEITARRKEAREVATERQRKTEKKRQGNVSDTR